MNTPSNEYLAYCESFSQWLDETNDRLPEPTSFSEWLTQNDDSIPFDHEYKSAEEQ